MEPEDVLDDRRLSREEKRIMLKDTSNYRLIEMLLDEASYGRHMTFVTLILFLLIVLMTVVRFIP